MEQVDSISKSQINPISVIVCVDQNNGIGRNGVIPWHLKSDMTRFRQITTNGTVIMGRRTWESIGCRPLANRANIVLTSDMKGIVGALAYTSLYRALESHNNGPRLQSRGMSLGIRPLFVIGGSRLYAESIPLAQHIYLTRIDIDAQCDVKFPYHLLSGHNGDIGPWLTEDGIRYRFEYYSPR